MAERQVSSEDGGFEVVSKRISDDEFISLTTANAVDGDPYEMRADIIESKHLFEALKKKLNFETKQQLEEVFEKLKCREALDSGIGEEVENLDAISKHAESQEFMDTAREACEYVSKVRQLAAEKKTTVKRALDILEIVLPIFIHATDIPKDDLQLSEEFQKLQEEYERTRAGVIESQLAFEMEQREQLMNHGKAVLLRSVSSATGDCSRIAEHLAKEDERENLEEFTQAKSDVDLIIRTEREELDAVLVSCKEDKSNIESSVAEQIKTYEAATGKCESRLRSMDVSLNVNKGRQKELLKQLESLKAEERRLENNRVFEMQIQERANKRNTWVVEHLRSLEKDIENIRGNASTAQEIILNMQLCSELLFEKTFEVQERKRETLRQLHLEALLRERGALSLAYVEFNLQTRISEENIEEYQSQLKSIHKEIERAAKKGQGISVSKKKQDFEDYKEEMRKEEKVIAENSEKCKELVERLSKADEQLKIYGVSSPPVDSLIEQKLAEMRLDGESGRKSLQSF